MGNGEFFRTERFRTHAARTFGRMGQTTLRRTGLEKVLSEATRRNLSVLQNSMERTEFERFKAKAGPEGTWREVKRRGFANAEGAKEVLGMSLGNPSAYSDYPPNGRVIECLGELAIDVEAIIRESSGYTHSFGYPPLLEKLKRANFCNPKSVHNDSSKFRDVRVYVTAGGSYAAEAAMGPAILAPEDTAAVHDWTYIIHLGAAYYRGAHMESFECRDDGRPDAESLRKILSSDHRRDHVVQAVVLTPIGNPVGAAMSRADIVEHLHIIEDAGIREGRPIIAIVDIAYEPFRRDGKPLDPIEIAIDERMKLPLVVLDTTSKGYGMCGWRLGKLAVYWPEDHFPEHRADYLQALENKMLPTLGVVGVPLQMAYNNFLEKLETDAGLMDETIAFFENRRRLINENLVILAENLREIPGVYLAKYYDHAGKNGGIEPDTLSSFYLLFGFSRLSERYGSGFNQAVAFGEFALDTNGIAVVNCVPGQSFLPEKRWSRHPALIRITGLTSREETESFLRSVRAFSRHLG